MEYAYSTFIVYLIGASYKKSYYTNTYTKDMNRDKKSKDRREEE